MQLEDVLHAGDEAKDVYALGSDTRSPVFVLCWFIV